MYKTQLGWQYKNTEHQETWKEFWRKIKQNAKKLLLWCFAIYGAIYWIAQWWKVIEINKIIN